jgi:hypothetical protein
MGVAMMGHCEPSRIVALAGVPFSTRQRRVAFA